MDTRIAGASVCGWIDCGSVGVNVNVKVSMIEVLKAEGCGRTGFSLVVCFYKLGNKDRSPTVE